MTIWPKVIAVLIALGLGVGVVVTYKVAIIRAERAEADVKALQGSIAERDTALSAWSERKAEWEQERKEHDAAIAQKETERKAAAAKYASALRDYRHAISLLDEKDRDCAGSTVPAAVDRLLERGKAAPAR